MLHIILAVVSAALLGLIVFFAVSPRSSRALRWAAVAALILIAFSLGVSLILLLSEPAAGPGNIYSEVPPEEKVPVRKTNTTAIISVLVMLILFMFFTVFIALRQEKRRREKKALSSLKVDEK